MSQDQQHGQGASDQSQGKLDAATLERLAYCAADDELAEVPADQAAAYAAARAASPELEALEQSQRSMRAAVGRCMLDGPACPQELRDRIAAMTTAAAAGSTVPALGIAGTPAEPPAKRTVFPAVRAVIAAAAMITVILSAVAYLQQNEPTQTLEPNIARANDLPTGVQLAGFMAREHVRCATHPTSIRKFTEDDLARVPQAFRDVLGERVTPEDLLPEGATFVAAGPCSVPGKGPSIHLLYRAFDPQGEPVEISLYIQRCGDKRFEDGKAYAVGPQEEDSAAPSSIIGWRSGELVYYLVTGSHEATEAMAESMNAPAIAGAI